MAIAQKCNYNMRRSIYKQSTRSRLPEHWADSMCQNITEPPPSKAERADELKPFYVRTLESIMVFITMVISEK
jgi:hypothetical protein